MPIAKKSAGEKSKRFLFDVYLTLGMASFSLGFALFISAIIKLLDTNNPWENLLLGLLFIFVPVILGIWKFEKARSKFMHNLKNLKVD